MNKSLLQIVITDTRTEARYLKEGGKTKNACVLVNLLSYDRNKSEWFWLVTVCREIAYIFAGRLGYRHQIIMRMLLVKSIHGSDTDNHP